MTEAETHHYGLLDCARMREVIDSVLCLTGVRTGSHPLLPAPRPSAASEVPPAPLGCFAVGIPEFVLRERFPPRLCEKLPCCWGVDTGVSGVEGQ